MNSSKEHHRKRAEASFKKGLALTTAADLAKADQEAAAQAVRDKTARLRSERLAKEAAGKKTASDMTKRKPGETAGARADKAERN